MNESGFIYRHLEAEDRSGSARMLLMLHGTGGNEDDLLPMGRALDSGAALLSPRGRVLENGMPRFFRRLAEGVFDEQDVIRRAQELADFIKQFARANEIDPADIVAVGYSNGANIASAMMLLGLAPFTRAILFRPMVPLVPDDGAALEGHRVFISGGKLDPIATPAEVQRLAALLRGNGADVEVQIVDSGHELTTADLTAAKQWLGS